MKEHKVELLVEDEESKPVFARWIEGTINRAVEEGWRFVQLAPCAESTSEGSYINWVYIVFERGE